MSTVPNIPEYVKQINKMASLVTSTGNSEDALDTVLKLFNGHLLPGISNAEGEIWMESNNVRAFYHNWAKSGYDRTMIPVVKTSPTMRKYVTILRAYSVGESSIVYRHPISGGESSGAWSMGDIGYSMCDKFIGVSSGMVFTPKSSLSYGDVWTLGSREIINQNIFDIYVLMDSSGHTVGTWDTVSAAAVGAKIYKYEIYKSLHGCISTSGNKWIGLNGPK